MEAVEGTRTVEEDIDMDREDLEDEDMEIDPHDDDDEDEDLDMDKMGELYRPKKATSQIWKWFRAWTKCRTVCHCLICAKNVVYGKSRSSSKLIKHLERHHGEQHFEYLNCDAVPLTEDHDQNAKVKNTKRKVQASMQQFIECGVQFPEAYVRWMCETYQPIDTCENEFFRKMIATCNSKIKPLACDKVHTILKQKVAVCKASLKAYLKGQLVALTADSWTSSACDSYLGVTAHLIDKNWKMQSFPLQISQKKGRSTANDCIREMEECLDQYGITWENLVGSTTDTEPTMCSFLRLFRELSLSKGGDCATIGCLAHMLNLITKIAFKDTPGSYGTMKAARALVQVFTSSTQMNDKLLGQQVNLAIGLLPVTVIQDIVTRWWSTYAMLNRLLRLKPYINMLVLGNSLPVESNLSEVQWKIVDQVSTLLQPFMAAQKALEGEKYVTLSLIPAIVKNIRVGLAHAMVDGNTDACVRTLAQKMMTAFVESFGSGSDGTLMHEHSTLGPRNRPKSFPVAVILAVLLDPRTHGVLAPNAQDQSGLGPQDTVDAKAMLRELAIKCYEKGLAIRNGEGLAIPNVDDGTGFVADNDVVHFDMFGDIVAAEEINVVAAVPDVNNNVAAIVDAELVLYHNEKRLPRLVKQADGQYVYQDPLFWWKKKQTKYPTLAKLARRYLCIPATEAPVERLFSTAGLTIAKDRSSLLPTNAENIILLNKLWGMFQLDA